MSTTYKILALSEVLSPLTHAKGVEGNESLIAREPVVTPAGVRFIPHLSGNALRHRLVRDPGAWFLIDQWELSGKLAMSQLNFFFHGGNLTQGGNRQNTSRISDMERLFPLIRLLGGSLPDQILSGSLLSWRGTMVCEENRERIFRIAPSGWEFRGEKLSPAESFVDGYQYTRGDERAVIAPENERSRRGEQPDDLLRSMRARGRGICSRLCFAARLRFGVGCFVIVAATLAERRWHHRRSGRTRTRTTLYVHPR